MHAKHRKNAISSTKYLFISKLSVPKINNSILYYWVIIHDSWSDFIWICNYNYQVNLNMLSMVKVCLGKPPMTPYQATGIGMTDLYHHIKRNTRAREIMSHACPRTLKLWGTYACAHFSRSLWQLPLKTLFLLCLPHKTPLRGGAWVPYISRARTSVIRLMRKAKPR